MPQESVPRKSPAHEHGQAPHIEPTCPAKLTVQAEREAMRALARMAIQALLTSKGGHP